MKTFAVLGRVVGRTAPNYGIMPILGILALAISSRAAVLVHDFYLPLPETEIRQAFTELTSNVGNRIDSVFSVVVTGGGTEIYYDHWEDGYEVDLANPVQSTTEIWGDGDNSNGIAPGFANDPANLTAGTVLSLRNDVDLPRNPSIIRFDAKDRMAATKALVVSRAGWATSPGPVLSGAVEVSATIDHGTSYICPVGEDLMNEGRYFQYVGLSVMATEDNTSVQIDPTGGGSPSVDTLLGRGDTYLVNGGVMTGATVDSSKPVQVQLVIGLKTSRYASDWFTLVPFEDWSSSYYTPVGTAADGNATINYFYNPGASDLTINYITLSGSGSFVVPAGGVEEFQMPQNSGARFVSSGGEPFFALAKVGARSGGEASYDWGFTMLPADGLTSQAIVGWGPGSSDGSVNGSPVWLTAVADTTVYVDYNGDHIYNGSGTAPVDVNGDEYDLAINIQALESELIFDPDGDQTAMRLYTTDGTLITAAWGEDPQAARPGNPYFDFGTTVLPFPTPIIEKIGELTDDQLPAGLSTNDTITYTITLDNRGLLPLGNTVVIDDLPIALVSYKTNTTFYDGSPLADDVTGTSFPLDDGGFTIPVILRDGTSTFSFDVLVTDVGSITNEVRAAGYSLAAAAVVAAPPSGGSTQSLMTFTDAGGTSNNFYQAGDTVYVRLEDYDNSLPSSLETIDVTVRNEGSGDLETITLTETGLDTGIFTNALPSDAVSGLLEQDGTLYVAPGDRLSVTYNDPYFGDASTATAIISVPSLNKVLYLSNGDELNRLDPVVEGGTMRQTALNGPSSGIVIEDETTTYALRPSSNPYSGTFSHVTGSGANRLLVVSIVFEDDVYQLPDASVDNYPTYGGQNLIRLSRTVSPYEAGVEVWYLVNPASGTNDLNLTISNYGNTSDDELIVGITTFEGVDPSNPLGTPVTGSGSASSASLSVSSVSGGVVYSTLAVDDARTVTSSYENLWDLTRGSNGNGVTSVADATVGTGASISPSWSFNATDTWAAIGASINPAPGTTGDSTTFTQAPVFATDFTIPSNTVISITNYVNITSGSMPVSPAVSAALLYDTNVIFSAGSASYNSSSDTLVWSGAVPDEINIPAGEALSFWVQNNESGVDFEIEHDSAAAPSKIMLPTTTVIDIASLGVYDAPYPDGDLVTAISAGSRLYIRAEVSDPFGAYDITGLDIDIDGPGTPDDLSVSLTDSEVAATNASSKIYEYEWQTGPNVGSFNLSAIAHEGSEGITDSAAASLSLVFLDLGTPAGIEFTSGLDGSVTNAFIEGSNIFIRVADSDQNYQATVAEIIYASIISGTDSNVVVLTEIGVNSGIFTGSIISSTTVGIGNTNVLNATVGSVITASYTDADDSGDMATVSGTILPAGAGTVSSLTVNKTLVDPVNGQAALSNTVTYALQVVNTGTETLSGIGLQDDFPGAYLQYVSASLAPDTVAANQLVWNDIGTLSAGESIEIMVDFLTVALGNNITNSVTASDGSTSGGGNVPISISESLLTVGSRLIDPVSGTAVIGSTAIFEVAVTNAGTTAITSLPIEHLFSTAQFSYNSMVSGDAPNGIGAGVLLWTNAVSSALLPGEALVYQVRVNVIGAGTPAEYRSLIQYATDEFGRAVPVVDAIAGLVSDASSIGGYIYTDVDESGTLTAGDTGLGSVSITLYSDPNGDGNPADGSVVRISTSGPDGFYNLPNLGTGDFVVVQSDLTGYASSSPNTVPVTITTVEDLDVSFFDYIPAAVNYASISGTVWLDADDSGDLGGGDSGLANVALTLVQDADGNGFAGGGEPVAASISTDASGGYTFYSVVTGDYIVVKTDLFGHSNVWDSVGLNDNQIGLTVTNGQDAVGNDFLTWFTGNTPGNDAPTAISDSYSVDEDADLSIPADGILGNDIDLDGDSLSAVQMGGASNGLVSINSDGGFQYTPLTNFFGSDSFSYAATDGMLTSAPVTVTITVNSVNDVPSGSADSSSLPEDGSVNIDVLGNDFDVENDLLSFVLASAPTSGNLVVELDGSVTYTPATNFFGPDSFTYSPSDGTSTGTPVTVSITVNGVNDNPVLGNDSDVTDEDTPVTVPVLGNDTDPDGTALIITGVSDSNATFSATNVVYTPPQDFHGTNTLYYYVDDGFTTTTGTLTIVVNPVNDAPVSLADSYNTVEDTPLSVVAPGVLDNDSDVDGDGMTALVDTNPTNGVLVLNGDGSFLYTPSTNYTGSDSFSYAVYDGTVTGASVWVSLDITSGNDAPVVVDDSATTDEDVPVVVPVLVNDSDPDNDSLTLSVPVAANGLAEVDLSGTNLVFTPATNWFGTNIVYYHLFDGSLTSTGEVEIVVNPINDDPISTTDSYTVGEDDTLIIAAPGVLDNDSDVDGDSLTAIIENNPTNGAVALNGDGSFTYTPDTNYFGSDGFTYMATDGTATGTAVAVTLTITGTNDVPNLGNDSGVTNEDTPVTVPVLGNDVDPDGDTLTIIGISDTNNATFSSTNIVFTPPQDYNGTNTLYYYVDDGSTITTGTLTIVVSPVNDEPVSQPNSYNTIEDTPLVVTAPGVLDNDNDVDGDSMTAVVGTNPTNGVLVLNGDGSFTYTPGINYFGSDSFSYAASDGTVTGAAVWVSLNIASDNDAPVVVDDSAVTNEDEPVVVSVMTNDTDPDNDPLILSVPVATNGLAEVDLSGTNLVFTPATNWFGTNVVFYHLFDGTVTSTGQVQIVVNPINDVPSLGNDSGTTDEDTPVTVPVLGNDSDPDGDTLTIIGISDVTNATFTTTNVVYTPPQDFHGTNTLYYYVDDGSTTTTGTLTIVVNPVNDAPTVANDSASTVENTEVTIPVLGNDSDVDGDPLSIVSASGSNGVVSVQGTNVVYTPSVGFLGSSDIEYVVSDGSISATGLVSVTISASADLQMMLSGPTNVIAGLPMEFTLTIANSGPSSASNIVVLKELPTNQLFSIVQSAGLLTNNIVSWPAVASLGAGEATNFTITVQPENPGIYSHSASAASGTFDPDPSNNSSTSALSRVTVEVVAAEYGMREGTIALNPQTGLFEQHITVTNTMTAAAPAFRVEVDGLRAGVTLWNATGTTNGVSYVQMDTPLNPGESIPLVLEYYVPDFQPVSSVLTVVWTLHNGAEVVADGGVSIGSSFMDVRNAAAQRFIIEFETVPGETYTVLYSDDGMATWNEARPPISAGSTRTQWYDDGPPKTRTHPRDTTNRFYKVIQH